MHKFFNLCFAANIILGIYSFFVLPPRVATHFGRGGMPDGWAPLSMHTLLFFGIEVVFFLAITFSPGLMLKTPPRWLNLPHKDFWLKPENRERTATLVSKLMWRFGAALFLFFFVLGLLSLKANLSDPVRLDERSLFWALGIFGVYIIAWSISLTRAFRIPDDNRGGTGTAG